MRWGGGGGGHCLSSCRDSESEPPRDGGSIAVLWEGLGLPVTLSTRGVDGGDRNTGGARAAPYVFTMLESPWVRCAPLLN